jgi:hypothetical protein
MALFEYKRRQNEHVLCRTEELQKLLESSTTSNNAVNNAILVQVTLAILQASTVQGGSGTVHSKHMLKSSTSPAHCSKLNVENSLIEYTKDKGRDDQLTSTKDCRGGQVHTWICVVLYFYIFFL